MARKRKNSDRDIMLSVEDKERQRAAQRYMREKPEHFVEYAQACEDESKQANADQRDLWDDLLLAYDNEMPSMVEKEAWQSDISTNDPFVTVQHAKSTIRQALSDGSGSFYDLKTKRQYTKSAFAEEMRLFGKIVIDEFQGSDGANFPLAFIDACEMAFAIGQSFEMIPIWNPLNGKFQWELSNPWNVMRDPYAIPRDPQSGNYWIREIWLDKWELLQLEKRGFYKNIEEAIDSESANNAEEVDGKEQSLKRSAQTGADSDTNNKFLQSYRVLDFYGRIVAPNGELLMDKGRFTILGNTVIRQPMRVPFTDHRWPGISFTALPHMIRYEGKSLIEGVLALWELFNNLMNMHVDNLNWQINNLWERKPDMLIDEDDDEFVPGGIIDVKTNMNNEPALRPLLTKSTTAEALANMQYLETKYANNSFTPSTVTGLPGYRQEVTKGEYQGASAKSMGVFHSMAKDLEYGAQSALWLAYDVIGLNLTRNHQVFKNPEIDEKIANRVFEFRNKLNKYVTMQVSGISNTINRVEQMQKLNDMMLKGDHPIYGRYMKHYRMLKAYYEATNLDADDIVVREDKAVEIDAQIQKKLQAQDVIMGKMKPDKGGNTK